MMYRIPSNEEGHNTEYEGLHSLFVRLNIAAILLTWCCLYAIKLSFLLLYQHIFKISVRFIRAWWVVLGIVILTFWILIAGSITQCGSPRDLENVGTYSPCNHHANL